MFEKMTEANRFVVAYTQAPTCYPKRIVPLKRDWDEEESTYDPPSWTHDIVFKNPYKQSFLYILYICYHVDTRTRNHLA